MFNYACYCESLARLFARFTCCKQTSFHPMPNKMSCSEMKIVVNMAAKMLNHRQAILHATKASGREKTCHPYYLQFI